MKQCPKCQANISDTAKFCVKCGCNVKKYEEEQAQACFCPECGTKFSGGVFCPECGFDVSNELNGQPAPAETTDTFGDAWLSEFESISNADVATMQAQMSKEQREKALTAFEYEEHADGTYTITRLKDENALQYTVPEGVVAIAAGVFENCNAFKITLAEGLLQIGNGAFRGCKSLSEINLPDSLMMVGDEAFAECEMLDVHLPKLGCKIGVDAIRNTIQDKKQKAEAEELRKAEETRKAEEARKKAEEARQAEEAARQKEEAERQEEEARKQAEMESRRKALEERARKNAAFLQKTKEEFLEKAKKRIKAAYRREGDTVYFGMCPQSLKNKNVVVYDQKDANGWSRGSDGQLYYFDTESRNYYKVEPIQWKVLYENGNEIKLVSDKILDFFSRDPYKKFHLIDDVAKIMSSVINDPILRVAYFGAKTAYDARSCLDVISVQDVEHLSKAERKKETTDFARRKGLKRVWAMVESNRQVYTLNVFGTAVPFDGWDDLGSVPCIKIQKKALDISDVDDMAISDVLDLWRIIIVKDIFVAPGDVVKKGDPLYKYDGISVDEYNRSIYGKIANAEYSGVISQVLVKEGDEWSFQRRTVITYFPTEDR